MHPQHVQFCDKARGPRQSFHNPLDGLGGQPLNYVHNWTSPRNQKESDHTWKACPDTFMESCRVSSCLSSSRATMKKVVVNVASSYANEWKGKESQA